jgi:hypothetical protein
VRLSFNDMPSRLVEHRDTGQATGESSRRIGFAARVLSNIPMNYDRERLETLRVALGASSLALRYDQTRGGQFWGFSGSGQSHFW